MPQEDGKEMLRSQSQMAWIPHIWFPIPTRPVTLSKVCLTKGTALHRENSPSWNQNSPDWHQSSPNWNQIFPNWNQSSPEEARSKRSWCTLHKTYQIAGRYVAMWGFPGGSEVEASACNAGDPGLIPGSGRSPGEGNSNPVFLPVEWNGWRSLDG